MNARSDIYNVPSVRDFTASTVMTSVIILVFAVCLAVGTTWFTTKGYDAHIHHQAVRTAFILPLIIAPLCTGIVGYQSVNNHRRMLEVSRLARTDEMTGLANRRAFMHAANEQFEMTDFDYFGLSVLIIDLDHFKQVNDVHGHDAGDEVLIQASQKITNAAPSDSLVARLGGEEFAVLMPYLSVVELYQHAEAIRQSVGAEPCHYQGKSIHVSASLGVGIANARDSVSSVLSRADDALYEAKDKGRNRFVVAA